MVMGAILRNLLWTAAVSRGVGEMGRALRQACWRAALVLVGLGLALIGAGFLLAAGLIVLADLVGIVRACLIAGAAFAVIAAAFLLYASRRRRRSSLAVPLNSGVSGSHSTAELLAIGRQLGAAASRHPGSFVAAAFVIGLIWGRMRR
jgi:hypothetical protein